MNSQGTARKATAGLLRDLTTIICAILLMPLCTRYILFPALTDEDRLSALITALIIIPIAVRRAERIYSSIKTPTTSMATSSYALPGHWFPMHCIAIRYGREYAQYIAATANTETQHLHLLAYAKQQRDQYRTNTINTKPVPRQAICEHEAAHATVSLALNAPVLHMTIDAMPNDNNARTTHTRYGQTLHERLYNDITIAVAGNLQDLQHHHNNPGSVEDLQQAATLALTLTSIGTTQTTDEPPETTIKLARDRATLILKHNQNTITALAAALDEKGRLDGWKIRNIAVESGLRSEDECEEASI